MWSRPAELYPFRIDMQVYETHDLVEDNLIGVGQHGSYQRSAHRHYARTSGPGDTAQAQGSQSMTYYQTI